VEAVIGTGSQQLQQLAQFLAPSAALPEHGQGVLQRTPLAAGAKQLDGEHQPRTPLGFAKGVQLRRGGRAQGGGEGAQALGIVAMQQRGADGAAEALFLRVGRIGEPAQLASQGGEEGAAGGVEVGGVHGQGIEPLGQAAGGCEHPLRGQGAQLLQQLGPARGQALAQVGKHPLGCHPIEHQPATGRQEREPLRQLLLQLAATAAEQGAVAQVEAEAAVLLANEVQNGEAALAGFRREAQAPAQLLQEHHGALGGPQQQHGVDGWDVEAFVEQVDREEDL
jgi:hypothetical protein